MVVGIIAAILLAAGLLPPYGELWKRRGRVIGINWVSTQDIPPGLVAECTVSGFSCHGLVWRILFSDGAW
jgi:hypothetical protein